MNNNLILQRNFRHLYADIFWYGILAGSSLVFLSIYAARLGASGFQIGLITAGPALVSLMISLPAGRWIENRSLIRTSFFSAALTRIGYLLLIFLPLLLGATGQVLAVILTILVMSFPGTVFAISFNAMLADVIPPDWRAEVIGKRNAILAASMTFSSLLSGLLLEKILFPINYQIVFGIGAIGAILSTVHISLLNTGSSTEKRNSFTKLVNFSRVQLSNFIKLKEITRLNRGSNRHSFIQLELLHGSFGLFILSYLIFYTFQNLVGPLFPLAYVQVLQISDWMISLGNALFYSSMFIVSLRLRNLSARYGHHRLLFTSAIAFSIYPLLIGIANGPLLYWVASCLGGIIYGLVSASLINRLMEVVPAQDRAGGMAFHNLALNFGILVGSIGGPFVSDLLGIQQALLFGAGMRFLAGLLLYFFA